MSAFEDLSEIAKSMLEEEGITQDILNAVDLSIAYSPVIAVRGESEQDAVKAYKLINKKYRIDHFLFQGKYLDEKTIKVMRARYLLSRDSTLNRYLK